MVRKAYVLIQVTVGNTNEVAKSLRRIKGVLAADVVTGPHDVIAVVEAPNSDAVVKIVTREIQAVNGVSDTLTYMVFNLE